MKHVLGTIGAYLIFNLAVWFSLGKGGLTAMGLANMLGALATTLAYGAQIQKQGTTPRWLIAALGSLGILAIVVGLNGSHGHLPVSLSIEAVYNGFALASWPMFVALNLVWPKTFLEHPNRFDLGCHCLMAVMVYTRFATYGSYNLNLVGMAWIALAVAGYMLFNVGIKLAAGHRATTIAMNVGGGTLLCLAGVFSGEALHLSSIATLGGAIMGGIGAFGVVRGLGSSYAHFGPLGKASLVAPLVYDGILVASPAIMVITGETPTVWTFGVAAGMLAITVVRYRHHMQCT